MTDWPTAPLIRINRARTVNGTEIENTYALRDRDGDYRIAERWLLRDKGDSIDEWEEATPAPTAALKRLRNAFRGVDVIESLESPLLEVLSHLPANKPSPLDRAVTRVKDAGGPMISGGDSSENRLSLLFDALASIAVATNKAAPLAIVARICVDWADLENPRRDALEATRERTKVLSGTGNFTVLSALVADVITALCENLSPRHDLIDAGAYALAWAAQIIEEEDK
jgi:hypothetical protein|nr:MAG TPA: hypothetical protein [Caudoviricetes sp.]